VRFEDEGRSYKPRDAGGFWRNWKCKITVVPLFFVEGTSCADILTVAQ
jgi:hypothetical protein